MTRSIAQAALWVIETNLRDDLDLDAIAAATGVSSTHACRAFSACFGISAMQYARRWRISEAAVLLRSGRHAIAAASAPDFELYPAGYDPLDASGAVEVWVPIDPEASGTDDLRRLDARSGT